MTDRLAARARRAAAWRMKEAGACSSTKQTVTATDDDRAPSDAQSEDEGTGLG